MLPRILAILLASASPVFAGGGGSQGAGTAAPDKPAIVPGTGGTAIVPGTAAERGGARDNRGSATPQGQLPTGDGTGRLPGKDVTTGGSAAGGR